MIKKQSKVEVAFFVGLSFYLGIMLSSSYVLADGLEIEKIEKTPIDAPPPPVLEAVDALFFPPEEEIIEVLEVPKVDPWLAISKGMVIQAPSQSGTIVASEDQKVMLGQGDVVYLSSNTQSFNVDQEWIVYKTIKKVHHPKTEALLGDLVYVIGKVKISDAIDNMATARITRSINPMTQGDSIAMIESFIPLSTEMGAKLSNGAEAMIIEVRDERRNNAQHDIVYIDQGKGEGVSKGDQFIVIHSGVRSDTFSEKKKTENSLPYRKIGTMVVLATQAHTATAKITQSVEPISKGDLLLFKASE